jgi:predicted nuclease of restriction endonuclease-like (RecB) superfamily
VATQLCRHWCHYSMIILGQSKQQDQREFYIRLAIQGEMDERELERQMKSDLFERTVLSPPFFEANFCSARKCSTRNDQALIPNT